MARPIVLVCPHNPMRNVLCGDGNIDRLPVGANLTDGEERKLSLHLRMLASNLHQITTDMDDASCVYVMSDIHGENVKIGEARDTNKRLLQLQAGNPRRLYIHRAFIFRNKQIAQYVESETHRLATMAGVSRAQSEWFQCSPADAHNLILSTIDMLRVPAFGVYTPGIKHLHERAAA